MDFFTEFSQLKRTVDELNRGETVTTPGQLLQEYMALGGLVCFYTFNSIDVFTKAVQDRSNQGRHLTLNTGGTPVFGIQEGVPYLSLDGSTYYYRASENGLNIEGDEAHNGTLAGLSMCCWVRPTATPAAANPIIFGKSGELTIANTPYSLAHTTDDNVRFRVRDSGDTANDDIEAGLTLNEWQFVVARYTPGSEIMIRVNKEDELTSTTGIPASLLQNVGELWVGGPVSGEYFTGDIALCALYAQAHETELFDRLYRLGVGFFNDA